MSTHIGMDSGVSVICRPADFKGSGGATIRVCVDGSCEERASGRGGGVVTDTAQAQLTENRPNGPNCEPVA
ncbi:hypothetical protein ACFXA0_00645 [Streptomyces cyaneofuscatus]|uniref:hypothetical protein n=1 Tax=Streptomyces TaxID=1883 RepID=UPI00136A3E56|nr:hypothetical protein [Streptomyces sp. SID2119]MYW29830.1 hypothetical protein [Streptomyces sp. SID2119]